MHKVHPRRAGSLSAVVVDSDVPGPCVAITGNLHGDEATGLVAVHALDARLQTALRSGRVVLYPSLNPGGLRARTRTLPDDGVDLNRVFPGDVHGGAASRVAAAIWADLLRWEPTLVVDLHADAAVAIPYAIVDRPVGLRGPARAAMAAELARLADATGLTVLREYRAPDYLRYGLDRSLAGAMVNVARVPALTLEVGPRRTVHPDAVQAAVQAVWRLLGVLGLVGDEVPAHPTRVGGGPWRRAPAPRVHVAGVFVPEVPPGGRFAAGRRLGVVRAVDGTVREEVVAPAAGVVASWADVAWVEPRSVVGTLGLEDT